MLQVSDPYWVSKVKMEKIKKKIVSKKNLKTNPLELCYKFRSLLGFESKNGKN